MYLFYFLSKKQTLKNQNYNSNNDNTNNHIYIYKTIPIHDQSDSYFL